MSESVFCGSMIGVDEAGKGAVVGSMFVSAVYFDADFSVPDSKRLSSEEREKLAERVREACNVAVVEITPEEIDAYVADGGMNDLMVEAHGRALDALDASGTVIADASDVSAERFARRLSERADDAYDVSAEHGADDAYDAVGAGSVIAKVERDAHVACYEAGSGYPGDPATVEFLRDRAPDFPDCVRESWSTTERLEREERQSRFEDFDGTGDS
ncbi:MAG: ribonuclease HII [Halobacteriales archaeon]|nr:ribonuclease HII [Halobacteriales archaeon]